MEKHYVARDAYATSEDGGVAVRFRIESEDPEGTKFLTVRIVDEAAGSLLETLRRVFAERNASEERG